MARYLRFGGDRPQNKKICGEPWEPLHTNNQARCVFYPKYHCPACSRLAEHGILSDGSSLRPPFSVCCCPGSDGGPLRGHALSGWRTGYSLYVTTCPRHKDTAKNKNKKSRIWMDLDGRIKELHAGHSPFVSWVLSMSLDSPSFSISNYRFLLLCPTQDGRFRATGSASDSVGTQGAQSH
ncbi:hypothetical protein TEQG_04529 [Trichophyton equinum CBS 127.97]|uniref:Uncharacterized protein n=1 Tax=Trichophyton equinum (strain ATCC MYA-4606 / CBS 127.97) TaxID=559882 RepID=F2PUF2_TRIEC|nr:hypothetical protein TEQG_04529 [Trichophyton equinum CBS 127.97]